MDRSKSLQKTLGLAILLVCIFVSGFISGRELQGKDIFKNTKDQVEISGIYREISQRSNNPGYDVWFHKGTG